MLKEKQDELKELIFSSSEGSDLLKRVLALLIDKSHNFTREVCLTLVENPDEYGREEIGEAARGLSRFQSTSYIHSLHLPEVMREMGTNYLFSVHYGDFSPSRAGDPFNTDGMFSGLPLELVSGPEMIKEDMPLRYTFWLARECYARDAVLIAATRELLDRIDTTSAEA